MKVAVVSARYAPCEGRTEQAVTIDASTRNVTIHVRALLALALRETQDLTNRIRILNEQHHCMNVIFGDPIPGMSKRLYIKYTFDGIVHTASFAEHEEVWLTKRYLMYDNDPSKEDDDAPRPSQMEKVNSEQSEAKSSSVSSSSVDIDSVQKKTQQPWNLPHYISEIVLPFAMEFLELTERVQCRLICTAWRNIIRERGVAQVIDDSDQVTFPVFTRTILRGLLQHSHSSLEALFLSGTPHVLPEDFHPAIRHLKRLRSLDISRCGHLSDETLRLLATSDTKSTLEVLYMKGSIPLISNAGIITVAQACTGIRVLDISYLTQITNEAMAAIEHLKELRSLFLRDNFNVTNDVVTNERLEQLALWGCIGLRQLHLGSADTLAVVNLWGCHSLRDDAANAFQGFGALRTLNMSECHRLTDEFVVRHGNPFDSILTLPKTTLVRHVPQLQHLALRYCRRITDLAVDAATSMLQDLQTLDLSFCSKLTMASLATLLEARGDILTELRLQQCRLDGAGTQLIAVIRSLHQQCSLSVLDVRRCAMLDHTLRQNLNELHFAESKSCQGLFTRDPRWGRSIEERYISYFQLNYVW